MNKKCLACLAKCRQNDGKMSTKHANIQKLSPYYLKFSVNVSVRATPFSAEAWITLNNDVSRK